MSAPQLLPRIQALEAKVGAVQGIANQALAAAQGASVAGGSSLNFLAQSIPVFTGLTTGAVAWTAFSSSQIPAGAESLLISTQARRDSGVAPGFMGIYVQAASGQQVFTVYSQNSEGIDSDTEGGTFQAIVPCANSGFYWSMDNGVFYASMWVIGYYQ